MKKTIGLTSLFLTGALWISVVPLPAQGQVPPEGTFYVAANGDDGADGSAKYPFATIGRAKSAVRSLIAAGLTRDVIVYIRGGTYLLNSTLIFDGNDSGNSSHSITYKAYPGEEVRLIAGQRLQPEWFTPVTDPAIIARMPAGAADHVLAANLPAHGITNYGDLLYRGFEIDDQYGALELFVETHAMHLARWPNSVTGNPNTGWESMAGVAGATHDKKFYYSGTQPERWSTAPDPWIWAYTSTYYSDNYIAIQNIDTANKIITLSVDPYNGIEFRQNFTPVWYGFNLLEELDAPEEWYLDRSTGNLYFYPPDNLTGKNIFVSMLDTIVSCQNAKYLNFEGLIFEMTRFWTVRLNSACDHIRFYQCVFRNSGTDSVDINGTNNGLDSCAIYNNGDGGIALHGGNRYPLTWANNYVLNSHIHNLNRWGKTYQPAIFTKLDCGMTVSHNLIHDLSGIAYIYSRSNEIAITYNDIYNVCQMVDDNGALYAMWDWAARGSEIQYNFIHHISSVFSGDGLNGVYFDSGGSGQLIKQNIFYNINGRAVQIGGGRDNIIDNNIIAKSGSVVIIDKRFKDPAAQLGVMQSYLIEFINKNPNWSTYYPGLLAILTDQPELPKYNQVVRNLGWSNSAWAINGYWGWWGYDWPNNPPVNYLVQSDNNTNSDPQFVDEANLNMNLQPGSPAYSIPGWQDIPFDEIGLAPTAPAVYLEIKGPNYILSGQCEPWASVHSAVFRETGQSIAPYLSVAANGAVSGTIPVYAVASRFVTVDLVTRDPVSHSSPIGTSGTIANADLSGNGFVNAADLAILTLHWLESTSSPSWGGGADLNQDGQVNFKDFIVMSQQWTEVYVNADLSNNGVVDTADLMILASHWLEPAGSPGWGDGADLNRDGRVNLADVAIMSSLWNNHVPVI